MAGEDAVLHAHGSEQLTELHAVLQSQLQLLLVGGHIALGAAVDQGDPLHAGDALGSPGGVHRGVAAADDHHVLAQLEGFGGLLGLLQERDDVHLLAVLQTGAALVPGAGGEDDVGIALIKELLRALDLGVEDHLGTHGLHELHIVVDGGGGNAEGGDHMAHDAAQGVLALEDGHIHAGAAQEVGGRHTGRAAADDGCLLAGDRRARLQLGQQRGEAALSRLELLGADVHALLIGVAHALVLAAVGADGAGDEGQGVAVGDDLQGLLIPAGIDQHQVSGNILLDGAAVAAGGGEAVDEGDLLV